MAMKRGSLHNVKGLTLDNDEHGRPQQYLSTVYDRILYRGHHTDPITYFMYSTVFIRQKKVHVE